VILRALFGVRFGSRLRRKRSMFYVPVHADLELEREPLACRRHGALNGNAGGLGEQERVTE